MYLEPQHCRKVGSGSGSIRIRIAGTGNNINFGRYTHYTVLCTWSRSSSLSLSPFVRNTQCCVPGAGVPPSLCPRLFSVPRPFQSKPAAPPGQSKDFFSRNTIRGLIRSFAHSLKQKQNRKTKKSVKKSFLWAPS